MSRLYASAPVMVWELAGRPRRASLPAQAIRAVCAMCGRDEPETIPATKTVAGKSFTDQYLLSRPGSTRTCYACSWACTGKGMDQIRMWTVLARTDRVLPPSNPKAVFAAPHLHFASRADMRAVVDTLADPPDGQWLVSVAESGQKHTLPYARINHGCGRWQVRMDALDIDATPHQFRQVFAHTVALRAAGHTAEEIEHLQPSFARLKTAGDLDLWRRHAAALAPWRASPLLHLAVFLPKKEHLDDYRTRYPTPGPDRPGGAVPRHDARLGGRGQGRPHSMVGPGTHSTGDRSSHGDTLF